MKGRKERKGRKGGKGVFEGNKGIRDEVGNEGMRECGEAFLIIRTPHQSHTVATRSVLSVLSLSLLFLPLVFLSSSSLLPGDTIASSRPGKVPTETSSVMPHSLSLFRNNVLIVPTGLLWAVTPIASKPDPLSAWGL